MRILIGGVSGLVGRALEASLLRDGHAVARLVRRAPRGGGEIGWDPAAGRLEAQALDGVDAVVNLSGESLAGGRWTCDRRAEIVNSRVRATGLLAEALATRPGPAAVFVSGSAVGIYGDRGEETLTEASATGTGFLAGVARAWEAAAAPAAAAGVRVVHPRFGMVLGREGGALAAMLPLFRLGLGGPLGNGRAWWSWVTLADAVRALRFAIERPALRGPFNVVAPAPARSGAFARALGRALGRPAVLPAPAFALRAALGRAAADELLLASLNVRPAALEAAGFAFGDPGLEGALASVLGGAAERR